MDAMPNFLLQKLLFLSITVIFIIKKEIILTLILYRNTIPFYYSDFFY